MNNPVELLSPSSLHLLVLLIVLAVFAFRAEIGSVLRRWRFVLLAAAAWCWLVTTPVVINWLALQLENKYPRIAAHDVLPSRPAIIVLSAGAAFERSLPDRLQLNLASYRRTQAAVALWQRTQGTLVFAGTIIPDGAHPVSRRMAMLAMQFGVPPDAIRTETKSLNTYENLRNAMQMIEPERQIIIVTSAMHMPRAMAVANELGLEAIAAPADFRAKQDMTWRAWLPDSGTRPLLKQVLHEWLGRAWYAVRGWT
ncbi:MAG TPA: YdcF family protein [Gammaproteobacteria bacterium]